MLIFRPLYIYNLSFLLSFASMFCIICLYAPLVKLFSKVLKGKPGGKIARLSAMTLSANIGVYPIMAHFFNSFSVYSLAANLILLPLINFVFIALFAACLASVILPFSFLVVPIGWILALINSATGFISGLPCSEIIIFSLGAFAALYYLITFVLGGHINIGKKFKALASFVLTVCLAMSAVFSNIPVTYAQDFFTAYNIPVGSAGLAVQDNSKFLIGEVNQYNYSKIKKELIKQKIRKLDCIIITSTPKYPQAVINLAKDFRPDKIAIVTDDWGLCDEIEVQSKIDVIQIFDEINYNIGGLKVYSYSYNNKRLGTSIMLSGKKFLYPLVFDENNLEILNVLSGGCDILVCDKYIEGIDFYMFLVFDCEDSDFNIVRLSESDNYTFLL
jgi:predicted membrane metal-binding protein